MRERQRQKDMCVRQKERHRKREREKTEKGGEKWRESKVLGTEVGNANRDMTEEDILYVPSNAFLA